MKITHTAVVTPHQSGLYETTRDIAAAERVLGHDARIVDPVNDREGMDRDVPIAHASFVRESDVIVNHSGLSKEMNELQTPVVHMLHGRPCGSFLLEQSGKLAIFSYLRRVAKDTRFKRFVTFWPEFIPYWETLVPKEKLHCIPPPVDLARWTPGPRGYNFHGHRGDINIACSDMWREDKTPYHIINAFLLFAEKTPGAKLHVYGAPQKGSGWDILKDILREAGVLGEVPKGMVKGLQNVYRAVDCVITTHCISTRSVREPLASGCNVVMAPSNPYTPFQAEPENVHAYAAQIARAVTETTENRKVAELFFDARNTASQLLELLRDVTNGKH